MNYTTLRCIALTCRNNINYEICRKISATVASNNHVLTRRVFAMKWDLQSNKCNFFHTTCRRYESAKTNSKTPVKKNDNNPSSVQLKKRPKKRKSLSTDQDSNAWYVKALATSEEYNLETLVQGLVQQNLYIPNIITTSTSSLPDVIHAVAKYEIECEQKEIFFFREGAIVMWNISELEHEHILQFLKKYEQNRYMDNIVQSESEVMSYSYSENGRRSHIKNGVIMLAVNATNLDKYTFSNAMAQSVKLGVWEASLDNYVDSIEFVTEDLKAGRKLTMTRQEVLRKQGELFALRHSINLSSDLLDTPDFYWERDDLERLFQEICSYFNIAKRTRVINEKLNHCVELVGILSTHLSDRHHIRLEWMIIILIMVEVVFEVLHYLDKYFT